MLLTLYAFAMQMAVQVNGRRFAPGVQASSILRLFEQEATCSLLAPDGLEFVGSAEVPAGQYTITTTGEHAIMTMHCHGCTSSLLVYHNVHPSCLAHHGITDYG